MRQIVVKLHSRCNLSCTYCYVYESVDQSWRGRPMTMSSRTIELLAERIAEHANRHGLSTIEIVLHGGEPLLAGHAAVEHVLTAVRTSLPAHTQPKFSLQTNGTLLDDHFLDIFHRFGLRVGVSLDGGAVATDRHRIYANG